MDGIHPNELTQMLIFADTAKDFEKITVNSSGYVESNKFWFHYVIK